MVEPVHIEGLAPVPDESAHAVFVSLAFVFVVELFTFALDGGDPGGRRGHFIKIEQVGADNLLHRDIAEIAFDDLCSGIELFDHRLHARELIALNHGSLVEQHDVAEFYLLDNQALEVVLIEIAQGQGVAAIELALHTERIHHRHDGIEYRVIVAAVVVGTQGRNRADGLGDGGGFTYAAGLYDDVVEAVLPGNLVQLLDKVHLESAADAAVLQGHERVILLAHDASLLYQGCVDVHRAQVVDDHGELDAFGVGENAVNEGCLTAAEVARQQQDGSCFCVHYKSRKLQ